MKKNKILIIVFKGIGDVILTTPLIKAIKKNIPDSEIYFFTRKFASTILENNTNIKEIIIREEKPLLKILKIKPNIVFDYMLSSSSGAYTLFSGAKTRISFYRPWGKIFYNKLIKSDFNGYTVNKRLELLKGLNINPLSIKDIKPEIFYKEENKDKIIELLKNKGIDIKKEKIITFDITSPRAYRQLSVDKFIFLADKLSQKGYKIIFHPAPNEENYVEEMVKKYSKEKNIILKKLSLQELSILISLSSLHIGTSSAPMHIAVSFNVPTFTIYSPFTSMKSWTPPLKIHSGIEGVLEDLNPMDIYIKIENFMKENKI